MEKIIVKDHTGTILHDTYRKRARSLVKKGRARFVDEHTICLLSSNMEDKTMETMYNKQDVLQRIDQILNNQDHIKEAMMLLERMPNDLDPQACQTRSMAIMEVVKQREETNRDMIELLKEIFEESEA